VQIAKSLGAHVTGVCGTRNVELVRSIGADLVIDYTKDDFTQGRRYDVVFDNIENRSLGEVRRALTPDGTLVLNSGTGASGLNMLRRLLWPIVLSTFVRHTLRRFISNPNAADLGVLKSMVEDGTLRPVIESTYSLSETRTALQHIESGHARGKVVIAVA
jgi:NADPH:quinone reductase-like Zn-dependent oxidoreductase